MATVNECTIIDIPKILDHRGNLAVVEKNILPFKFKRVYYLYDVPFGSVRGGHAHIKQYELLLALSGSFEVKLDDGFEKTTITLNNPTKGLLISTGIWRELENFSSGSVCLVFSSGKFLEEDYIRDYDQFKLFKKTKNG